MKLSKLVIPLLVSVAFGTVCDPRPAIADFSSADWKSVRDISLPTVLFGPDDSATQGYVRLKLDNSVAGSSRNFKDVRVIEASGREVPYQLVVEEAVSTSGFYPSTVIDRSVDAGGRLQFVIDLGSVGQLHNRINIVSSSKNYRRQVSVYASNRLPGSAETGLDRLTDQGYIFKFTDPTTGFSTAVGTVDYPQSSARYLLVRIENGLEGPIGLENAQVYTRLVSQAKEEQSLLPAVVTQNLKEQSTELVADFGAIGVPTRKVTLRPGVSERSVLNFSRTARVFGSNTGTEWALVGNGQISQLSTSKFTGRNMTVEYPESFFRYYKVVVLNFDDTPLSLEAAVVFTHVLRVVVFKSEPTERYSLYYGNDKAFAPRYDLARFFNYLDATVFPEATLDAERANPSYVAPEVPVAPFSERYSVVLNSVLAALVLVIGGLIFLHVFKNLHKSPKTPEARKPEPPSEPPVEDQ